MACRRSLYGRRIQLSQKQKFLSPFLTFQSPSIFPLRPGASCWAHTQSGVRMQTEASTCSTKEDKQEGNIFAKVMSVMYLSCPWTMDTNFFRETVGWQVVEGIGQCSDLLILLPTLNLPVFDLVQVGTLRENVLLVK